MPDKFMTFTETMAHLRVSKPTLLALLAAGKIPGAFRAGRAWRIPSDVAERMATQQAETMTSAAPAPVE